MANTISASEGYYQDTLAHNPAFLIRLKAQMIAVALNVKAEPLGTSQHLLRSNYANVVLGNAEEYTRRAATVMADTASLLNKTTIVDGIPTSSATDGDIFSGVTAAWTILAGGDTGS